jgi:hypothetical protein
MALALTSASFGPERLATADLPAAGLQGNNDWRPGGYGGSCPPVGTHRYVHKIFALGCRLPDLRIPGKAALEMALQGHILAYAKLIGLYRRQLKSGPSP